LRRGSNRNKPRHDDAEPKVQRPRVEPDTAFGISVGSKTTYHARKEKRCSFAARHEDLVGRIVMQKTAAIAAIGDISRPHARTRPDRTAIGRG
jgi:hypothetical protein